MDNTVFFQKLLTGTVLYQDFFFNYLESNSINKYIELLSRITQKNNIENNSFHINLRNALISNIYAYYLNNYTCICRKINTIHNI